MSATTTARILPPVLLALLIVALGIVAYFELVDALLAYLA